MEHENQHHKNCLLQHVCRVKGTDEHCKKTCPQFVTLHGLSGEAGLISLANTPQEYRLETLSTSKAREKQPEAYRILDKYEESFSRFFTQTNEPSTRIKNLYLWSDEPGTGKTLSATCLLNNFLIRYYIGSLRNKSQVSQRPIFFLDVNQFQTDYLEMSRPGVPIELKEAAGERYYKNITNAKNAELVVFDEIGSRSVSEALRSDIMSIINERMYSMKPSIFTSNLPLEALPELFNEKRLFDRIRDLCVSIEFKGPSQRGKRQ